MKKINTYAGYICLKPINGVIFPSYAQNQINKEYIETSLNGKFFLSTNENMYSNNDIVLNSLIREKNNLKGIVMLSAFSLPKKMNRRNIIYKNLFVNKKNLYFVFEEFHLKNKKDINYIEEYLLFREDFFTKTVNKLSNEEKRITQNKDLNFI